MVEDEGLGTGRFVGGTCPTLTLVTGITVLAEEGDLNQTVERDGTVIERQKKLREKWRERARERERRRSAYCE